MALEIIWSRLGALLIGGSVYAFAVVLAVFLLGIAIGANLSKMSKKNATYGTTFYWFFSNRWLYCLEMASSWTRIILGMVRRWKSIPTGAILLAVAMAGAPVASGVVFGLCLQHSNQNLSKATGNILTSNTVGGVIGVFFTGTYLLPFFGIYYTTIFISSICVLYALYLQPKEWHWGLMYTLLVLCLPSYDIAIYATGLYNRIGEFVNVSPRAIENLHMKAGMPDSIKMVKVHLLLWDNPKKNTKSMALH